MSPLGSQLFFSSPSYFSVRFFGYHSQQQPRFEKETLLNTLAIFHELTRLFVIDLIKLVAMPQDVY